MAGSKTGPLTMAELQALWVSVTDTGYSAPFIELGEGQGFEAYTQAFVQAARVSEAIDRTTQSLYFLPWSGQTSEPASGAQRAQVDLVFTRTTLYEQELTFAAGTFFVEEETTDYGSSGPVTVRTGRRYVILETKTLAPGDPGPLTIRAEATVPGYGHNNPPPGDVRGIVQLGAGFMNSRASVVPGVTSHRLVVQPEPDVVIPEHVGRYVLFVAGSNAGRRVRIVGYEDPVVDITNPNGGTAVLAPTQVLRISATAGTFILGEVIEQVGASARLIWISSTHVIADRLSGNLATGIVTTGVESGATVTCDAIEQGPDLLAESGTASWVILDWAEDLGLAVTNPDYPSGGRAATLDELAAEREVYRGDGEDDETLRQRATTLADVVSPNAIVRTANRILGHYGLEVCLREVGLSKFRGLFYDGDPSNPDPAVAFAFDLDFALRPQDRFRLNLSYEEFRGFFLLGVPPIPLGDFGAAFDAGACNAFDASPFLCFFDGFPVTQASVYRSLWQAVYGAKAGGVGFDLYQETIGCL
jgi:hypothetical protein